MKTLVLTDNPVARSLAYELQAEYGDIDIFQSPSGTLPDVPRLDIKRDLAMIASRYSLVLSLHCTQIFPATLISQVRCVNVHPGFNPYNRGWYPHVFSLLNGLKAGVTIHEMDEQIDHGPIIVQQEIPIQPWETSESVYANLMNVERQLLLEWFVRIRERRYAPYMPAHDGNLNTKKEYEALKRIDLDRVGKFGDFLNLLRGLSHGSYSNAYFIDEQGRRVYVKVILELDIADATSISV